MRVVRNNAAITNLDWHAALRELRAGRMLRRADWEVPVRMNVAGSLEFAYAAKDCGQGYEPTADDRKATDWISQ